MTYYIEVEPNIRLFVNDLNPKGEKTILFIHGWPGNQNLFEYQFDELPKMNIRCIGIDCRGFGKSDKPFTGYDYNRLADDVKAVVDYLDLNDFVLAGHSTGGAIAVRYMARHNGYKVSKLALFAAAAPSLIQRPYFPHGLPKEEVEKIIDGTYSDRPKVLRDFGDIIFYKYVTKDFSDWILSLGLEAAGYATAAIAKSWINEEGLFDDLNKIIVPTLILHSIHDKVCLFPLAIAQKEQIKNSKLVEFYESGHFLFYDEKERFNNELIKFVME